MKRHTACVVSFATVFTLMTSALWADFIRGDTNRDGRLDVSDAVTQILTLFGRGGGFACEDAADANDDGEIDLTDALRSLAVLFGNADLPSPGALTPGPDPTCDRLDCGDSDVRTPAVVINEIQYHPLTPFNREYVELFNRSDVEIDLSSYRFTRGITYQFPLDAAIAPRDYVVVALVPAIVRVEVPLFGPFEGRLADGGERLTLEDGDCEVESVRYDDRAPWPVGADGYGPSLERVDVLAPAEDPHSWRSSTSEGFRASTGTVGEANTTAGVPAYPLVTAVQTRPPRPGSSDAVEVEILLDIPPTRINRVDFSWQVFTDIAGARTAQAMSLVRSSEFASTWVATLPPQASQSLIRFVVDVALTDGRSARLPPSGEPRPFYGYFVYDFEIPARLPIMWRFPRSSTEMTAAAKSFTGIVIVEPGTGEALVFDAAIVQPRFRVESNGHKVRFIKGEEYRGDRTLNVFPEKSTPETPTGLTFGEDLGFRLYNAFGVTAPRSDWFRVIDLAREEGRHTQNLVVQQVNERFLEMNGLDAGADLWKVDKVNFAKRTNPETGNDLYREMIRNLNSDDAVVRRQALELFDLENVGLYSVVGALTDNWDGFHNNIYFYRPIVDPGTPNSWRVIPWDLDQLFGDSQFAVDFPLTGITGGLSRDPGVVSRPFHRENDLHVAYLQQLASEVSSSGRFTVAAMESMIQPLEALLLEDLALQEQFLGTEREVRRQVIQSGYARIRDFVVRRGEFLRAALSSSD